MGPWDGHPKKQEKEIKQVDLPSDVMRTSKLNIMQKDINFNLQKILNLGEIPRISKAYIDANRVIIPPDLMRTGKVNKMTKKLDMNNFEILNVPDPPTTEDSAISKRYVDARFFVQPSDVVTQSTNLSFLSDLNMNNHRIKNLKLPQEDTDAISKKNFDDKTAYMMLTTKENDMEKPLNMNLHRIKELADPVDQWDSVHKTYADKHLSRMPVVSDPDKGVDNKMHTPLDMNNHPIYYLKTEDRASGGSSDFHAVNRRFLNKQFNEKLFNVVHQAAPSILNDFDFKYIKLLHLKDDNSDSSGITKKYVDDLVANKQVDLSKPMTNNLDMNQHENLNLKEIPAISKAYVDNQYLRIDGTKPMAGTLNMNNQEIIGLKKIPAASKAYVDQKQINLNFWDQINPVTPDIPPFNGHAADQSSLYKKVEGGKISYAVTMPVITCHNYFQYWPSGDEKTITNNQPINFIDFARRENRIVSGNGIHVLTNTKNKIVLKKHLVHRVTAWLFFEGQIQDVDYTIKITQDRGRTKYFGFKGHSKFQTTAMCCFGDRVDKELSIVVINSTPSVRLEYVRVSIEGICAFRDGYFGPF